MNQKKEVQQLIDFQEFLSGLTLSSHWARIKTFEEDLRGNLNPAGLLHALFFEQNQFINFESFFWYYYCRNENLLKQKFAQKFKEKGEEALKTGLQARLYRTQCGILTEYHAFFAAKCIFGNENVQRSPVLDASGVDFQIRFSDQLYNVHIFSDTERAWKFRRGKSRFKSAEKLPGVHLNLPYSIKPGRFNSLRFLPNRFGVFTSDFLLFVKKEMEAGKILNNNIVGTTGEGFIYA